MQEQIFYSNGKLLLTGEYVVLDGAQALAVPTKFGQNLIINQGKNKQINWKSYDSDKSIWFEDVLSFEEIKNKQTQETNSKIKNTLLEILYQAYVQNPTFIEKSSGYEIKTHLTFPRLWGLGTSSTLINNIAHWLQIDAFQLIKESFGGSGYDVACAQNNKPIIYAIEANKPKYEIVDFNPLFKENIHFVYLNQKQSSKSAISNYITKQHKVDKVISKINNITQEALKVTEGRDFALLMEKHQAIMSDVLETETVKEMLFPDFKGVVKSLGAWGGDFVMVLSKDNPKDYFIQKGYTTILTYEEMVL